MAYQVATTEGKAVELTAEQAARYDEGDAGVIQEVAANLPTGEYSVYAPDGPLLENIAVR